MSSIFAAKHNLQGGGRVIPLVGLETPAALPGAAAERARRVRPRDRRRHRRGIGDAGRRRPGHRQVDLAAPGRGAAGERGQQSRLRLRRGIGRAGAAARGPAGPRPRAGAARGRDLGARHPDDDGRRRAAGAAGHQFDPDHAQRPDRGRAGHRQPGPRLGAGAGALRQGAWHRRRARRPRHQGRHDRRPARARAYGRHGAELRGRAQPPVPHPPRDEEPLRRHRRDRRVRDGRARG